MEIALAVSGLLALLGGGAGALAYYRNNLSGLTAPQAAAAANIQSGLAGVGSVVATDVLDTFFGGPAPNAVAPPAVITSPLPTIVTGPSTVKGYVPPPPTSVDTATSPPPSSVASGVSSAAATVAAAAAATGSGVIAAGKATTTIVLQGFGF
jgi:hypothetical protein